MNTFRSLFLALRSIRKSPAFSAVIIFTFSIAMGTCIVIYSYIDAYLLTSLPFEEPENLIRIHSFKGEEKGRLSYPEFLDMHPYGRIRNIGSPLAQ